MGAKEVAAGAEWLDENFPGWEREIDLGKLDLSSCTNCVCGQSLQRFVSLHIRTGFDYALWAATGQTLFDTPATEWATNHGFYAHPYWEETETLWRDLIKERFSTGNLSDV